MERMRIMNNESKLKPFNLEAALKGEKVVTRDGRIADRFHKFDGLDSDSESIYAVVEGVVNSFWESGSYSRTEDAPLDLFMAPKERVVWFNIYPGVHAYGYESEKEADERAAAWTSSRVGGKAFPITITEGE